MVFPNGVTVKVEIAGCKTVMAASGIITGVTNRIKLKRIIDRALI